MKLGLVSAILDWMSFEEMIDTISSLGYECVEAACWPSGKAERRYAGVSHIDVDELSEAKAEYILNYCKEKKCGDIFSGVLSEYNGRRFGEKEGQY